MATLPSAQESAKRILEAFAQLALRPGEDLAETEVHEYFLSDNPPRYRDVDFVQGLNFAKEQGWVEIGPSRSHLGRLEVFLILTSKGFAEMPETR
jgi:hypothetical protein